MSEELMDLLIGERFEKATYHRKVRTGKPAVHRRKVGFCEPFGKYLWLLRTTGARPGELRHAEAHNYENGRLVFRWNAQKGYLWKNAKKSRHDRIIFLPPDAQAYVEECIAEYPEGPIFRTLRGDPWAPQNVANKWRCWLLLRPKVVAYMEEHGIDPKEMRTYNFRHSAIGKWPDAGGDIYVAAQLFGTSVKMLEKRCGHLNIDLLHEKYMAFATSNPVPPPWASPENDGLRMRRYRRRWIAERTFAWLYSCRRVLTRHDRRVHMHDGLTRLAWRSSPSTGCYEIASTTTPLDVCTRPTGSGL